MAPFFLFYYSLHIKIETILQAILNDAAVSSELKLSSEALNCVFLCRLHSKSTLVVCQLSAFNVKVHQ